MDQHDGKTVLVVNDDPTQLRLLTSILQKDGLQVLSCESAEEGLALMQASGAPDVLVTDLHMPGIDGWRFSRLLRSPEYGAFNQMPILVVSATFAGGHAQEVTRDLGANAFLSLPCPAADLRKCVQALLNGQTPKICPKVLIVEDSPTLAGLLERTFLKHGYHAAKALTGEEGRRVFQELSPEVVILDYHLPDLTGDTLLSEFTQAAWHPAVIMITTDANPRLATLFLKLGANGYLRKPFDPRYLVELCHQVGRERALLRVEDILEARTRQLRESEARLRESEENYRLLVGNLPAVVFTGYADCSVDFYDDKIEELTGHPREEFATRRRNWREVILSEDWPGARHAFLQALKGSGAYVREYRIQSKSGTILWIQERSQIIRQVDGQIACVQGIFFDITDRKRLEEERLKLDKLESLGLLAGGIAHDFNNLLTAMLGNINLVSLTPELPGAVQERLAEAEQACLKAQALSQQLLTFAKGGAPIKKVTALVPLVTEAATLALAGSRSRADLSLPGDLWPVKIDAGQIGQVLNNILINADQAMPEGGAITVEAQNLALAKQTELPLPPGPYVRISILDQGIGIDPKYLGKIFDPYFTTKQKGSGLGLATAFAIAKKHGGQLTVSSTPGAGTLFALYLPATSQAPVPELETKAPPVPGQGKILVMDDEALVRQVAGKILQHLGYEVESAADGAEALAKYRQAQETGQPFDVVILDLTVPGGVGGKETMAKLQRIDPKVRGIVNSGYADDPILTHYQDYGFHGYIKKPYRVQDVGLVLAEVLRHKA